MLSIFQWLSCRYVHSQCLWPKRRSPWQVHNSLRGGTTRGKQCWWWMDVNGKDESVWEMNVERCWTLSIRRLRNSAMRHSVDRTSTRNQINFRRPWTPPTSKRDSINRVARQKFLEKDTHPSGSTRKNNTDWTCEIDAKLTRGNLTKLRKDEPFPAGRAFFSSPWSPNKGSDSNRLWKTKFQMGGEFMSCFLQNQVLLHSSSESNHRNRQALCQPER